MLNGSVEMNAVGAYSRSNEVCSNKPEAATIQTTANMLLNDLLQISAGVNAIEEKLIKGIQPEANGNKMDPNMPLTVKLEVARTLADNIRSQIGRIHQNLGDF